MLNKSVSGVLTSFRASTYPKGSLGPSLAAALLDSLFEHPVKVSCVSPGVQAIESLLFKVGFFAAC